MAPPRGGDMQNKQEGEVGCANWSKEALLIFCDLSMLRRVRVRKEGQFVKGFHEKK